MLQAKYTGNTVCIIRFLRSVLCDVCLIILFCAACFVCRAEQRYCKVPLWNDITNIESVFSSSERHNKLFLRREM